MAEINARELYLRPVTPQQLLARLPEDELAVKVSREDLEVRVCVFCFSVGRSIDRSIGGVSSLPPPPGASSDEGGSRRVGCARFFLWSVDDAWKANFGRNILRANECEVSDFDCAKK